MTRCITLSLALLLGILSGRAFAADRTNTEAIRQQLGDVERKINDTRTKIREEIQAEVQEKNTPTVDWTAINQKLDGELLPAQVKGATGDVTFETTAPAGAKLMRDKLIQYRAPLDQLDAQVQSLRTEYDRLKNLGGVDFGGFTRPFGAYSEEMREILKKIAKYQEDRPKLKKSIEAQIAADPDTSHQKSLEAFEKSVERSYQEYYERTFGAGNAGGPVGWLDSVTKSKFSESRALRIRRLLLELASLVADRDRLLRLMKDATNRWVVWNNEIGWLYVGTVEEWERQKFRTRASETWGGLGSEPLVSTQILTGREFWSQAAAVKAVMAEAGGPGYIARHPLAFPKWTRNVKIGGKEYFLNSSVTSDASFEAAAKKADEEAAKPNP